MKNYFTKHILAILLFAAFQAAAQDIIKGNEGMYPSFVSYKSNQPAFNRESISVKNTDGKTLATSDVKVTSESKDEQGITHTRYLQSFNGIPVEHAMWVVHSKQGKIYSQNGKLVKTFPTKLSSTPSLEPKEALKKALMYVNAKHYKWEYIEEEAFIKREKNDVAATFYPKEELVYYSGESDVVPSKIRLAYKFDIYAKEPLSRKYVFVDALNGEILGSRELIHETNANGTAVTAYSGTQNIVSDFTGATYRLRETNRGTGNGVINTYNLLTGTNYGAAVDFTDADNNWNNVNAQKDEYATDAHWGTEMTYDYFLTQHNRNSYDGAGAPLNSYVHYDVNYFNAFWDGTRMTYGDGSSVNSFKPLTSLDVCGHEITHGVTNFTSNLTYSYESGALNEGFSDIFGTAIEAYARPANYDWLIGADFFTIRSMSNPNAYGDPDTYFGTNWYHGSGDNGGVHTNSGVLNYWFYLLVNGGSGTNDHGTPFNVTGIGMTSAAQIAYKLNTFYLVSSSTYADARTLGIQAAVDIFGSLSNEATQTANAWDAVGLYAATCGSLVNLSSSGITETTADVAWDAMPGATYYLVQYKAAASGAWITSGISYTNSHTIIGLSASTLYDWRVRASCASIYSAAQFTSGDPECNPPTTLEVSIDGTTAFLEWAPTNYASVYHVQYKEATSGTWLDGGWVTGVTQTLSGLNMNTLYDWSVETGCSFDTSDAAYSTFTTNIPSCGAPTGLSVAYTSGLTTTMSWNTVAGAVSYRVQIKWQWGDWSFPTIDSIITGNSFTVVGFMSGMTLDWRVRAICSGNQSVHAYSTLSTPCPDPSGLTASSITGNSAVLTWSSGGANSPFGYDVDYKLSTSGTWIHSAYVGTVTHTLNGLVQGKIYDARVRQECYSFDSYYIQTQFTTPCSIVPNPSATELKTTSAKITWASTGAATYTLQYKTAASSTWITISGITANFRVLTGLSASTTYNFRVSATCTAGGTTAYSSSASFATYCNSYGNNSQEWIDYFSLGTISRTSGAEAGGYVHTGLSTNLLIGSSGNSGLISAGFSSTTRTEIFAIYIDLNRNGVYTDAGERVSGPTTFTSTGNIAFSIAIPSGSLAGITSMRVVMVRNGAASMAPCLINKRGEIEDYFVNLTTSSFNAKLEEDNSIRESGSFYKVIPNPSSGIFKVECADCNSINSYEIINISGAILGKKTIYTKNELLIDISNYAQGVYFLKINDTIGNMQMLKIVKN